MPGGHAQQPAFYDPVKGLLLKINDEVDHLPNAALVRIGPVLVDAQKELEKQLAVVLAKHQASGNLDQPWTAQHLRNALVQVQSAVSAVHDAQQYIGQQIVSASDVATATAIKHLGMEVTKFSAYFEQSVVPVPLLQASQITQRMLADRFPQSVSRWGLVTSNNIRHQLTLGMVRHETFQQMTNRLLGVGNVKIYGNAPAAVQAQVIAGNTFRRAAYEARRLVRTEVLYAYNAVKSDVLEQLHDIEPELMQRWDAAIDARICPVCRDLDHVVVPIGKNFAPGIAHPPLHPHCRCAVVAWKKTWNEQDNVKMSAGVGNKAPAPTVQEKKGQAQKAADEAQFKQQMGNLGNTFSQIGQQAAIDQQAQQQQLADAFGALGDVGKATFEDQKVVNDILTVNEASALQEALAFEKKMGTIPPWMLAPAEVKAVQLAEKETAQALENLFASIGKAGSTTALHEKLVQEALATTTSGAAIEQGASLQELGVPKHLIHPLSAHALKLLEAEKVAAEAAAVEAAAAQAAAEAAAAKAATEAAVAEAEAAAAQSAVNAAALTATENVAEASADNVLFQKVGDKMGTNEGGVFIGKDGVKRYVKFYTDEAQAATEHLAAQVYRDLGVGAPETVVFKTVDGKTAFASTMIEGAQPVKQLGIDKALATEVMQGFTADVLTANWDVLGVGNENPLANIVKGADGKFYRIDNGGSFLFKGLTGTKPESVLNEITEVQKFLDPNVNWAYAQVAKAAGVGEAEAVGLVKQQVQSVIDLRAKSGGWKAYLDERAQFMSIKDRQRIAEMLEARTDKLAKLAGKPLTPVATPAAKLATKAAPAPTAPTSAPPITAKEKKAAYMKEYNAKKNAEKKAATQAAQDAIIAAEKAAKEAAVAKAAAEKLAAEQVAQAAAAAAKLAAEKAALAASPVPLSSQQSIDKAYAQKPFSKLHVEAKLYVKGYANGDVSLDDLHAMKAQWQKQLEATPNPANWAHKMAKEHLTELGEALNHIHDNFGSAGYLEHASFAGGKKWVISTPNVVKPSTIYGKKAEQVAYKVGEKAQVKGKVESAAAYKTTAATPVSAPKPAAPAPAPHVPQPPPTPSTPWISQKMEEYEAGVLNLGDFKKAMTDWEKSGNTAKVAKMKDFLAHVQAKHGAAAPVQMPKKAGAAAASFMTPPSATAAAGGSTAAKSATPKQYKYAEGPQKGQIKPAPPPELVTKYGGDVAARYPHLDTTPLPSYSKGFRDFGTSHGNAETWGKNAYQKWKDKLPSDENSAIRAYTGSSYTRMNDPLREGHHVGEQAKDIEAHIRAVHNKATAEEVLAARRGLMRGSCPEDIVVKRGMGSLDCSHIKAGDAFADNSFISTSLTKPWGGTRLEIEVPRGTPGAYAVQSHHSHEIEFILPPGTRFRVTHTRYENGEQIIRCFVEHVPGA